METNPTEENSRAENENDRQPDHHCPVCGSTLLSEKCKVVCRSPRCVYRIIFNCAEF